MEKKKIADFTDSMIFDLSDKVGQEVVITGQVYNIRELAWGGFLILRTPRFLIQTVFEKNNDKIQIDGLMTESTVKIKGRVRTANIKDKALYPRDLELELLELEVITKPSSGREQIDITKKELHVNLDTKFDNRPYTLRHPNERAIFRIQSVILNEFSNYLSSIGFTRISSPKIVFSGAEGGSNVYKLDYFGKEAYLAQSPQFYKQMSVGVFGRVYETGSVFRAEKHNTSRHLNEYVSLDFEMQLDNSFEEIIAVESKALNHIFDALKEQCAPELELLDVKLPRIDEIVMVKFEDVHKIIFETYGKDYRGENDLAPEEERLICDYAKEKWDTEFVFVTHYPSAKRPFYAKDDPNDPGYTLSFDLLFRGVEITTGGQRLCQYEDYIEKMQAFGLDTDKFESYLQAFKVGMPPHGGLGLGLERLTAMLCNISNVKEASLFPRDINRLEP